MDHYVDVRSSGLPFLTARLCREPTTIAKRVLDNPCVSTTTTPTVYGTYMRVRSSGLPFLTARAIGNLPRLLND